MGYYSHCPLCGTKLDKLNGGLLRKRCPYCHGDIEAYEREHPSEEVLLIKAIFNIIKWTFKGIIWCCHPKRLKWILRGIVYLFALLYFLEKCVPTGHETTVKPANTINTEKVQPTPTTNPEPSKKQTTQTKTNTKPIETNKITNTPTATTANVKPSAPPTPSVNETEVTNTTQQPTYSKPQTKSTDVEIDKKEERKREKEARKAMKQQLKQNKKNNNQ